MRRTPDLSGEKPKIDVRTIKAGNFPGFGTTWIINNIIKRSDADILELEPHLISLEITDASATLTGGPPQAVAGQGPVCDTVAVSGQSGMREAPPRGGSTVRLTIAPLPATMMPALVSAVH